MRPLALALFWGSAAVIAYAYLGYPLLLALLGRFLRPRHTDDVTPAVDVVIAAYNEAGCIEAKLENTLALDYPADRLRIWVVTDGSTDATPDLVQRYAPREVTLLHRPERQGKAAALARALPHLVGEAILFTDANCSLPPHALRRMARHLADPQVGGVSGAKRVARAGSSEGENLYWRYEGWLKALDARLGSVMGAPGEVWLARRAAYRPPPPDILLDDFYASIEMAARGWRVAYEPDAWSLEPASPDLGAEWQRRVRNAAGGWQAVLRLRAVWRGGARLVFQYLSHRVLRWVAAPLLLPLLLLANLLLLPHPVYTLLLAAQGLFYAAALAGWALARQGRRAGWLAAPLAVVMLNAAALAGGWRYLRGQHTVLWPKVRP
jgi:cellulose synthase/poly-beta-1,6-N-acetylglucosamine synthase-like glycosyltransferase